MTGPPRLSTARLAMRPFEQRDVDDVFAYASHAEFGRYVPVMPYPYAREDAVAFVEDTMRLDPERVSVWAIALAGRVIGAIDLRIDRNSRRGSLGYGIAVDTWGRGLTTEAARTVVDFAFEALDLQRVYATADARNVGSWRVMEHLGMQREGVLRRHRMARDGLADEVLYGLLRAEWEAARRA